MASDSASSPDQQIRQLFERAERDAAEAAEKLVGGRGFSHALALMTENVVALTRVGNEGLDLALRNLRLAGRRDLNHLAAQLVRTEDKLERVLQEVEALRDDVAALRAQDVDGAGRSNGSRSSGGARSSAASGGSRARSASRSGGGRGGSASAGRARAGTSAG